ncbi:hypothetical protein Vretifemale_1731 [Volvox reticuliferus]|uniref:Protein kinase domain-containing protein n=1 Tax=Volvox reticuliferus TaxID=1737510 RepID=A0A8J4BWP9_9CHLO|nr:hypothetical protein Vretifemale_1731 [Volvox reticuliferus]
MRWQQMTSSGLNYFVLLVLLRSLKGMVSVATAVCAPVTVSSGVDLVRAFTNPCVTLVILATDVYMKDSDWDAVQIPLQLNRSVTVRGSAGNITCEDVRTLLDFGFVAAKIQLADGITLEFNGLFLMRYRIGNQNLAPGMDILVPTSPGASSMVIISDSVSMHRACYPVSVQQQSMQRYPRPQGIAGTQLGDAYSPLQPSNCVNDSSVKVPPLQRCWAHRGTYIDVAGACADLDKYGKTVFNRVSVHLLRVVYVCEIMMTDACVLDMGFIGCAFYTYSNLDPPGIPPGSLNTTTNTLSQGFGVETGTRPSSGDGSVPSQIRRGGPNVLGVALGVSLGGAALLLMFVAAVAIVRCRINQRQPLHWRGRTGGDVAVNGDVGHQPRPSRKADKQSGICRLCKEKPLEDLTSGCTSAEVNTSAGCVCASSRGLSVLPGPDGGAAPPLQPMESSGSSSDRGTCIEGQRLKVASTGAADVPLPLLGVVVTSHTPHRPDVNFNLVLTEYQQQKQHHSQLSEEISNTRNKSQAFKANAPGQTKVTVSNSGPAEDAHGAEEVVLLPTVRGKGSFGRVVEGVYQGRKVAVKLLAEGLAPFMATSDVSGPGALPNTKAVQLHTLGREVEVLARCCHPNVIRLLAACVTPPSLCLVMELMDTSLEQLIRQAPGRLLPMSAVLHIAVDVARGLEYLHPTIVHRDLKPANVLVNDPLGPKQVAKLSDFGLARLYNSALITVSPEAGTPPYMAPECFDALAESLTHHMDIYSLGMLLWVMLSGLQPWQGLNMVQIAYRVTLSGERPPLSAIPPDRRPHKLLRLLQSCWEADPQRRPAAAEVVKELMLVQQMMSRDIGCEETGGKVLDGPPASAYT